MYYVCYKATELWTSEWFMDRTGPIKANWDCQATSDWRRVKVGADFLFCGWAVLRLVLFSGLSGSLSWSLYFAANGSDFLSNLCTKEEAFNPVQPFVRTYNSFFKSASVWSCQTQTMDGLLEGPIRRQAETQKDCKTHKTTTKRSQQTIAEMWSRKT